MPFCVDVVVYVLLARNNIFLAVCAKQVLINNNQSLVGVFVEALLESLNRGNVGDFCMRTKRRARIYVNFILRLCARALFVRVVVGF